MNSLVSDISRFFPSEPVPAATHAVIDTYAVEHLHEILAGRAWPTLTPLECRHCDDGFTFLTPIGLHYYLPAYMATKLVDPETADCLLDSLIGLFQGDRHYSGERNLAFWQLLDSAQLSLVGRWLDHFQTAYHFYDSTISEVETARSWIASFPRIQSGG